MANKYYWLKLQKDFFKRHDIRIIESMENGEKYVLFYLKLICESITHDGELRFSEIIPYSETMLANITNMDIDVVRSAMKLLTELGMVQILDDATIFMTECEKMIGKNDGYERVKKHRDKKKIEVVEMITNDNVTETFLSNSISNSNSISLSNIKDSKNTIPPTIEMVVEYCKEKNNGIDGEYFWNYYEARGWKLKNDKMKNWHSAIATWVKNNKNQQPQGKLTTAEAWEKIK